jgi:hypothetical protein
MGTFHDPVTRFAPLEVIERLLEIRAELGYTQSVYLPSSLELAEFLDAHGFDAYVFSDENKEINYGKYRSPLAPGGDHIHGSLTAH